MAFGDQAGKAAADEVVAQLPGLKTFIDEQVDAIRETVLTTVGDGLKAVTFEREEMLAAADAMVHGWLDRLSGVEIRTADGTPVFRLFVPAKKEQA